MMAEKPQEKADEGKKRKQQKEEEEDNDHDEANREAPKKKKGAKAAAATKGGKGEKAAGGAGAQFELGNKRMVTVDTFGGKLRVDLREYYLKVRILRSIARRLPSLPLLTVSRPFPILPHSTVMHHAQP